MLKCTTYICSSKGGNVFFLRGCWHVNRAVLPSDTIVSVLITSFCSECSEDSRRVRKRRLLDQPASTRASTADQLITAANYQTHWCQLHANSLCLEKHKNSCSARLSVNCCLRLLKILAGYCFASFYVIMTCMYLCIFEAAGYGRSWVW